MIFSASHVRRSEYTYLHTSYSRHGFQWIGRNTSNVEFGTIGTLYSCRLLMPRMMLMPICQKIPFVARTSAACIKHIADSGQRVRCTELILPVVRRMYE